MQPHVKWSHFVFCIIYRLGWCSFFFFSFLILNNGCLFLLLGWHVYILLHVMINLLSLAIHYLIFGCYLGCYHMIQANNRAGTFFTQLLWWLFFIWFLMLSVISLLCMSFERMLNVSRSSFTGQINVGCSWFNTVKPAQMTTSIRQPLV